ncbi:embryo-specific protein ATS3B-like [Phoenix dactylifera]|uniref:Embryo-specific protein ATS3B-like n=1 Tax=Phoenix dactylifera TaxID=42345 RepID=A0A8B7BHH1_PHODC|nr:embryo-specific protein ATS3B-like [Phoenix dactylifera]
MVKMSSRLLVSVILVLSLSPLDPSGAEPVDPRPHELRSLESEIQEKKQQEGVGRGCSYTVKIKTSCSSRRYTRDMISLAFGDAYHNEVYAPRLDDPTTDTFERCSTDTFKIQGPCGYGICYLYLRRDGWDGWTPEWVKVYEPHASRATTFYYGTPLPNAVWYGFNHCPRPVAAASSFLSS